MPHPSGPVPRPRQGSLRSRPDYRPRDVASLMARRLTYAYVLGLGLLAAIILGSGWILSDQLQRQKDNAALINVVGAQRMLTQRIAALAPIAADGAAAGHAEKRRLLDEAVQHLRRSHAALLGQLRRAPARNSRLLAHYLDGPASLDASLRRFLDLLDHLAPELSADLAGPLADEVRDQALGPLLAILDGAVALHEEATFADGRAAQRTHRITILLALSVLLAEMVLIFRPLVHRARVLAAELALRATTDPLTGLLNRRAVKDALKEAVEAGLPVVVAAIDLDHFKRINDLEGHDAGDAVLCAVAARLRGGVRPGDVVGRMGGDEFVVLLRGVASAQLAVPILERLRSRLNRPLAQEGRVLPVGATLGFALVPDDASAADAALQAADMALIRAKQQGRGSVGRTRAGDAAETLRDGALLRSLRALEAGPLPGLYPCFQPIVSLADGRVLGLEALARWTHAEHGEVPPGLMFTLARQLGLVPAMSRQVREAAFAAHAAMLHQGLPVGSLSVNLSAEELRVPGTVEGIEHAIRLAGLEPERIVVEITEDVLLDEVSPHAIADLVALREGGIRLALDDFGTGTSGLAQLLRLPLDILKLDRTFTRHLGEDGRSEQVIRSALRLARSLRLGVVIEGVETAGQARTLGLMGCEMAQGWHFARALTAADLADWMAGREKIVMLPAPRRRLAPAQ